MRVRLPAVSSRSIGAAAIAVLTFSSFSLGHSQGLGGGEPLLRLARAFAGDCSYRLDYSSYTAPANEVEGLLQGLSAEPRTIPRYRVVDAFLSAAGGELEASQSQSKVRYKGSTSLVVYSSEERTLQYSLEEPSFPRSLRLPDLELAFIAGKYLYIENPLTTTLFDLGEITMPLPTTAKRQATFKRMKWEVIPQSKGTVYAVGTNAGYPRWEFYVDKSSGLPLAGWRQEDRMKTPSMFVFYRTEKTTDGQVDLSAAVRLQQHGSEWLVSQFEIHEITRPIEQDDFRIPVYSQESIVEIRDGTLGRPHRVLEWEELPGEWRELVQFQ